MGDIDITERHIVSRGKAMQAVAELAKALKKDEDEKAAIGFVILVTALSAAISLIVAAIDVGRAGPTGSPNASGPTPGVAAVSPQPSSTPERVEGTAEEPGRGESDAGTVGAADDHGDDAAPAPLGIETVEPRRRAMPERPALARPGRRPVRKARPRLGRAPKWSRRQARWPRIKPRGRILPRLAVGVHPGGFCGDPGAVGTASNGCVYVCRGGHWRRVP